jgi:hypothetical protein
MRMHKIILTVFISFFIFDPLEGKIVPDICVKVFIEDAYSGRTGVQGVTISIVGNNYTFQAQAVTNENGSAVFKNTGLPTGTQIRILVSSTPADGEKVYQGGIDKNGMLIMYEQGMQQNFIITRNGQAWPDYLQWEQGQSDNATPHAYVDGKRASESKNIRPAPAPYMGTAEKTPHEKIKAECTAVENLTVLSETFLQTREKEQYPPSPVTQREFLPSDSTAAVSTTSITAQTYEKPDNESTIPKASERSGNNIPWLPAFLMLLVLAAAIVILLCKRNKR